MILVDLYLAAFRLVPCNLGRWDINRHIERRRKRRALLHMMVADQLQNIFLQENCGLVVCRAVAEAEQKPRMNSSAFYHLHQIAHCDQLALWGFDQQKSMHGSRFILSGDRLSRGGLRANESENEQ